MSETPRHVDVESARHRFETALAEHEQAFETFFLARLLSLSFEYLPEDASAADKTLCRIRFPAEDIMFNPQGGLHGGAITTVMDISMGHLIKKVAGAGATLELKVQFLQPVEKGEALCEGRFLRRGRSVSFMESRLFSPGGPLAAVATATWKMPRPS